jgi:hypothetical protein
LNQKFLKGLYTISKDLAGFQAGKIIQAIEKVWVLKNAKNFSKLVSLCQQA